VANFFIRLINYFIAGVGSALTWLLELLPESPFSSPATKPSSIDLGYVTWLIPFPTMIGHLAVLITAITVWYSVRVAARWLKVAKGG
jgi:hypothetical protein